MKVCSYFLHLPLACWATAEKHTLLCSSFLSSHSGKVSIGIDVWESSYVCVEPDVCYPIGGSGQINGGFTMLEKNGLQLGIHAQEHGIGPVTPTASANGKVSIYQVETGIDPTTATPNSRAWWNFDWHLDLCDGTGVFQGKMTSDFKLELAFKCIKGSNFGGHIDLLPPDLNPSVLIQDSWNLLFNFLKSAFPNYDQEKKQPMRCVSPLSLSLSTMLK